MQIEQIMVEAWNDKQQLAEDGQIKEKTLMSYLLVEKLEHLEIKASLLSNLL